MSAYFIANIAIHDEKEYAKYCDAVEDVFRQFNGKYLAIDENPEVLEGQWAYSRLVLIEFPDKASLKAWYHSNAYQAILQMRLAGAKCDAIIAESL